MNLPGDIFSSDSGHKRIQRRKTGEKARIEGGT
jgi:hypothetical protein